MKTQFFFLKILIFNGEICIFHMRPPSLVIFVFFFPMKNHFKKIVLESSLILVFFLRENKIRNKNPSATPYLEKTCLRNRVQINKSCYLLGIYGNES